jgi:isopropylmalate/homocitrate/citramalate synthase
MTRGTFDGWRGDVDAAVSSGADIVHSFIPTSRYFRGMYSTLSPEQTLKRAEEIIRYARDGGAKQINISLLDVPRTDETFLLQIVRVLMKNRVDRIRIADTIGTATPEAIYYLVSRIRKVMSEYDHQPLLGLHCHNDFGLALANVFAGVRAGADLVDVKVNGLGDRSGNPSFAEVIIGLEVLYNIKTGIDLSGTYGLSKEVEELSRIPIPTNRPFVGKYAFTDEHESHINALQQDPFACQGIRPESIGNKRLYLLGKFTGPTVLRLKSKEIGLSLDEADYPKVIEKIKDLAEARGGMIADGDLIDIVKSL